jgi:hypothetical protein
MNTAPCQDATERSIRITFACGRENCPRTATTWDYEGDDDKLMKKDEVGGKGLGSECKKDFFEGE